MSDKKQFSDEELTAYLDGEDFAVSNTEIEKALESDLKLQARLEALSFDKKQLGDAFDVLLCAAPTMPEMHSDAQDIVTTPQPATRSWVWQATAAAAVALVVGFGAGNHFSDNDQSWREFVATYQALYANGTLAHISQSDAAAAAELARVSAAIAKDIKLGTIHSAAELDYKRAQILSFEGRPLIQLAFLSKIGSPVALCIVQSYEGRDNEPSFSTMRGMSSASWSKDGYEYLLIGGGDNVLIKQVAENYSTLL